MRHILLITSLVIALINNGCNNCKDSEKQKYIIDALSNNSTSPDYVVFKAVDTKTNKSKEICCESGLLNEVFINDNISNKDSATLLNTHKKAIEKFDSILASKSCDYSFDFRKPKSLDDIGFNNYFEDSIKWYSNKSNIAIINTIIKQFNPNKKPLLIDYFKHYNIYLIHVLNRNGVFCGRDCESGYIVIRKVIK
jgi:hypothetical protein